MKYIDSLLDRVTMYKLLMYYLIGLILVSALFGMIGGLPFNPMLVVLWASFAVAICWVTDYIFSKVYEAPNNPDSSIITGLILALLITPTVSTQGIIVITAASGLAIASKYMLAISHKHIFNPAAIAIVLLAFGPQVTASWWVGGTILAPFVIIGGFLIVRKIRHLRMVGLFLAVAMASTAVGALLTHKDILVTLQATLLHSPLFFLAFIMLTEPLTSPSRWAEQRWYVLLVGVLFAPQLHIGDIYSTPELALVIGNIASFMMTPLVKTKITLRRRIRHGLVTEDFIFTPEKNFTYQPGQYMAFTLPHAHADSRGVQRYFTLASSPTESDIRIGVRFYEPGSSFKTSLRTGGALVGISAGQLSGEFTLPKNPNQKLAFIAGGIGVTPFRSMVKYLTDTGDQRSVKLLYGERTTNDIAYADVFEAARATGVIDTTYIVKDYDQTTGTLPHVQSGAITADTIQVAIPDYTDRLFYISGPQGMVRAMRDVLLELGVKRDMIKTDYFTGYAS